MELELRKRIVELEKELELKDKQIAALEALVKQLEQQIEQLTKLILTSKNSSLPPSKDPPSVPPRKNLPSGKHRGAQIGHKKSYPTLLEATETQHLTPKECAHCSLPLHGQDTTPACFQQIDIPSISPIVTNYFCHTLRCKGCGKSTSAKIPTEARTPYGPRLSSFVALCTGKYNLSKRLIQGLLKDMLGIKLSLGSVSNIEQKMSIALQAPVDEAKEFVRYAKILHADETGWRENKQKAWMWLAATKQVALFHIAKNRSKSVAQELFGKNFSGYTVTDRYNAYNWIPVMQRQICWAHLIRDFQSWVDGGGKGAIYGEKLLEQTKLIFDWWHRVRDGTSTRKEFEYVMRDVSLEVMSILADAQDCENARVAGMARQILKVELALWLFVYEPEVEPTNNFAEQCIRRVVLWRKGSFGTDSERGSRFVERIMTVVTTLKLQKRNVLEYLVEAYRLTLQGLRAPSILPAFNTQLALAA